MKVVLFLLFLIKLHVFYYVVLVLIPCALKLGRIT